MHPAKIAYFLEDSCQIALKHETCSVLLAFDVLEGLGWAEGGDAEGTATSHFGPGLQTVTAEGLEAAGYGFWVFGGSQANGTVHYLIQ